MAITCWEPFAVTRWEPFPDLGTLQERMNRLFEEVFRGRWGDEELGTGVWSPAVDIHETENEIVLTAELPGVDQKDVDIRLDDNTLTLKGERKVDQEVKRDNYIRVERTYGSFARSFSLPGTVDPGRISAKFKDGLLRIVMPRKEETKPKQITIQVK